jgi:DNA (cytosine-5)-methyltransferase 1
MENVKNLYENERWASLREDLQAAAHLLGYSTRMMLLNSADFGVPQTRERMFFVGLRGNVTIPKMNVPINPRKVSVRHALGELPHYGESGNNSSCTAKITTAAKPILRKSPYAGMMFNGAGRPLDLVRPCTTLPASMGGNRTPIIEQNVLDGDDDSWVRWYHSHLKSGGAPIPFENPVPDHLRRLTVEEAAVLQGFPIGMKFSGPVSAQFRQIGNSVAPPVAEAVADYLNPLVDMAESQYVPSYTAADLIGIASSSRPSPFFS